MAEVLEALIQQLIATHHGEPWYGSSREKLLAGVSADEARATPVGGAHSIWEEVLHMTSWTREVTRRIEGRPPENPVEGDWPSPAGSSEAEWGKAKAALAEAHRGLVDTIRRQPASRWNEPVGQTHDPGLGTGLTVLGMVIGLAQHDAYHIGQVAMLRRAGGSL